MRHWIWAAAVLLLTACPSPAVSEAAVSAAFAPAPAAVKADGAAVGWVGIYRGDLPCMFCGSQQVCGSPCGGVDTELLLLPDGRYRLAEVYRLQPPVRRKAAGRVEWLPEPGHFRLDAAGGRRVFRLEENRLRCADPEEVFWGDAMFELMKAEAE